jgi:uncharacterized protein Yka (UPF0111/DUF47 family)
MPIKAEKKYLEILEILGDWIVVCGSEFANLVGGAEVGRAASALRIDSVVRSARDQSKQLIHWLNRAAIKPLDEGIVRDLAAVQIAILQGIAKASNRFLLYEVGDPGTFLPKIAQQFLQQSTLIRTVVAGMARDESVLDPLNQIVQLDKEVQKLIETGILHLFGSERDPIEVIKRKQVLTEFQDLAENFCQFFEVVRNQCMVMAADTSPRAV